MRAHVLFGGVLVLAALTAVCDAADRKASTGNGKMSASARAASKRGKHLLRYKFEAGETLRYDVKSTTRERVTKDGQTQQVEMQSESVKAWRVTDVLPSGEIEFVHVVESVKMSNGRPGGPTNSYDSRTDAKPPHGFEQAAAAVGAPLSVVRIKPTGEVVSREQKQGQQAPSEDLPITLLLPDHAIRVGEKWGRTYDVVAKRQDGIDQKVRTRRQCQLRQVKGGIAVIDVSYDILSPVDSTIRAQLVERLTKGTVRFDVAQGRIVSQRQDVDRRLLGFSGDASSIHYLSRFEEKLLPPGAAAEEVVKRASAEDDTKR